MYTKEFVVILHKGKQQTIYYQKACMHIVTNDELMNYQCENQLIICIKINHDFSHLFFCKTFPPLQLEVEDPSWVFWWQQIKITIRTTLLFCKSNFRSNYRKPGHFIYICQCALKNEVYNNSSFLMQWHVNELAGPNFISLEWVW